jgi:hypothetical protein
MSIYSNCDIDSLHGDEPENDTEYQMMEEERDNHYYEEYYNQG